MFRTDVPTAAGTLPTPAAPGTPGFFSNGNPALGIPSTVVTADWLNGIQEELTSLLTAAGISPIKSSFTQVLAAVRACFMAFDVSPSVNVLVANPTPAMTSLVPGTRMVLVPAFTNTGASTFNVSSLGALAVLRPDATVVQQGDLPAGRRIPVIYDGAAWRMENFPVRSRLSQPLTIYCNPQTGNDSNNGLTQGTAFASLQGVWNYLYLNFDTGGQTVTVQCSGNFSIGLNAQTVIVGSTPNTIIFNFAAGSTISTTNVPAFEAGNPGVGYTVTGPVVISASGTGTNQGFGIYAYDDGQIYYSGVNFGVCGIAHAGVAGFGIAYAQGNFTISGGAQYSLYNSGGDNFYAPGITVTINGTPAFSQAFMIGVGSGAQFTMLTTSFVGSATGPIFILQLNASLNTGGRQTSTAAGLYIPGSSAGSVASGGQYA